MAALFCFFVLYAPGGAAQAPVAVAKPEVKAGDRWVYRRTDRRAKPPVYLYELQVSFVARHERSVKVSGWEDIEVPAGRFRVLKVEANGVWRRLDTGKSDWARNTVWYSPRAKRWVKSLYEDAQGIIGEELVFYVLQ